MRVESGFYVGNVLPDLISMSGDPRVRPESLSANESPLQAGMAFHFSSDRRFHALSIFGEAMAEAKALLLSAHFPEPQRRVFFLAHVIVEIALDRDLLLRRPEIAPDFYAQFDRVDLTAVVAEVQSVLGTQKPLTALTNVLHSFMEHPYLYEYVRSEGCADALHRICRRAGVVGFPTPEARHVLAGVFDAFGERIPIYSNALLSGYS